MSVNGYMVLLSNYSNVLDDNTEKIKYEIGKTYSAKDLECDGLVFFSNMHSAYGWYGLDAERHLVEVIIKGHIWKDERDICKSFNVLITNKITVVREVSDDEIINSINCGKGCCGIMNFGKYNVGDFNEGDNNFGYHNNGNMNVGSCNDGDCNFGYHNQGCYNIGDYNVGYWNKCDNGFGFFNTKSSTTLSMFNKPIAIDIPYKRTSCLYYDSILDNVGLKAMNNKFKNNIWVSTETMTDVEKERHNNYKVFGGYLKELGFDTACKNMWDDMSVEERDAILTLPNFDPVIFGEITGINVKDCISTTIN